MKSIFLITVIITVSCNAAQSQSIAINNDGSIPHPSAMLDIKNPNKGLLLPRVNLVSESDITTIPNPHISLLIYNTNNTLPDGEGYYFWNGALWNKLATRSNLANLAWSIGGNIGTNANTDFIGTTDNRALVLKTNNILSGKIDPGPNNAFFGQSAGLNITNGNNNSFYGQNTGTSTTTGSGNLFAGQNAGTSNTTGSTNVFLGQGAGKNSGGGNKNVFIGEDAGFNSINLDQNVAIGTNALYSNKNGNSVTATGYQSLYSNISGNYNTANGYQALFSNTNGDANTAVGQGALFANTTGNNNTATGQWALQSNTTGIANTANGYHALSENTTGIYNTGMGYMALLKNTSGDANTATGYQALYANTTGIYNLANGYYALQSNTTGYDNTALGAWAAFYNTNGDENTAVGQGALYENISGNRNAALGRDALAENKVGDFNTSAGYQSGPDVGFTGLFNTTAIGYNARVTTSNTMVFGDANVDRWAFGIKTTNANHAMEVGTNSGDGNGAFLSQGGTWNNTSSKVKKEDFSDVNGWELLQKIQLMPVQKWKYKGTNEYHIGPVAEDFYKLFGLGTDDKGISTVDPAGIALAAIQEQQKIIEKQHKMILLLEKRIEALEKK
jgi:trimeric autotransporter adhesin